MRVVCNPWGAGRRRIYLFRILILLVTRLRIHLERMRARVMYNPWGAGRRRIIYFVDSPCGARRKYLFDGGPEKADDDNRGEFDRWPMDRRSFCLHLA